MSGCADHANISALPCLWVEHVEGIALRLDAGDHLLSRPSPTGAGIADVGDVLVHWGSVW